MISSADKFKQDAQFCEGISLTRQRVLEDFEADCRRRRMVPHTIRTYRTQVRIYLNFLDDINVDPVNVDRKALEKFLDYLTNVRRKAFGGLENQFSALSTFYDYLIYEEFTRENPILPFRRRFLRYFKETDDCESPRKLISVEEMSALVNSILNPRDRAIVLLLAKTGIRREELVQIDISDVNWPNQSIMLKPRAKRSNRLIFFDEECNSILKYWVEVREDYAQEGERALFTNDHGNRINADRVYEIVTGNAERLGFHNRKSKNPSDHFFPHCFRHWFTTHLLRNGMRREYVQELRGDRRREAIDIYHHIDKEALRKEYLSCIPKLGID